MANELNTAHPHAALDLRAVDRLVAEKVFGLHVSLHGRYRSHTEGAGQVCDGCLLHYTTSWDAAGQVVERMRAFEMFRSMGGWMVSTTGREQDAVFADTAPLAICLAALKALGVEVDQPASTQTPQIHDSGHERSTEV